MKSDLINTNRLRLSARRYKPGFGESFRWFRCGRFFSADHGARRRETNVFVECCGWVVHLKWRPDGKRSTKAP